MGIQGVFLLKETIGMLGAWIDPLYYIATELSRMEDAPNDIISKAKDIEGKIRGLLEALKRILSKVCSSLLIFLSFISFIRQGAIVVRNECRAALQYIAELNHQLLYQNLTGSAIHLQGPLLSTLHIRILNTKQVLFIAL